MKNHLKRIASPRSWKVYRKRPKFITRPKPGPHAKDISLPLGLILRDFLHCCQTMREAKKLLNNQSVLVDGKRRKEHRLPVGLFDVLSIPEIKKHFRLLLDKKGRLSLKEIDPLESGLKPCKIIKKTILPKNRCQFSLSDGRSLIAEQKARIGDTFLITIPEQKIVEVFELKKDAFIFLSRGKHAGDSGLFQEIKGKRAVYLKDGQSIGTSREYIHVLGDKKPAISI